MKGRPFVFSASIGNGHHQAAKAVSLELEKNGYEPRMVDTFYSLSPVLHQFIVKTYLSVLKVTPAVWGKVYVQAETTDYSLLIDKFSTFFCNRLYELIEQNDVPFIISTHPLVTPFLTTMKEKKKPTIPLYQVITDFVLHPAHLREGVNRYFTADPALDEFAAVNNYASENFSLTGIPVLEHPAFQSSKKECRDYTQLPTEKKIVLIAGGGIGLTKYESVLRALERVNEQLILLCMTGTNEKAARRLRRYRSKHTLEVIPFTDRFLHYLKASDVVISKSGGLTMAEALICETPILIFKPVPGQEERNAKLLVERGAAVKVESDEEMPQLIEELLHATPLQQAMKAAARKIKRPDAAKEIVAQIVMHKETG